MLGFCLQAMTRACCLLKSIKTSLSHLVFEALLPRHLLSYPLDLKVQANFSSQVTNFSGDIVATIAVSNCCFWTKTFRIWGPSFISFPDQLMGPG